MAAYLRPEQPPKVLHPELAVFLQDAPTGLTL